MLAGCVRPKAVDWIDGKDGECRGWRVEVGKSTRTAEAAHLSCRAQELRDVQVIPGDQLESLDGFGQRRRQVPRVKF